MIPSRADIEALIREEIARAREEAGADGGVGADSATLWQALALAWDGALRPIIATGVVELADRNRDGEITEDEIEGVATVLLSAVSVAFVATALSALAPALLRAYRRGKAQTAQDRAVLAWYSATVPDAEGGVRVLAQLGAPDRRALAWLTRHNAYFVTSYGTRWVEPQIAAVARRVLSEGLDRQAAGEALEQALGSVYTRGISYWRLVANAAVQKSRAFAQIEAFQQAGVREAYASAVLDRRTSETCEYLDGRAIDVADLVAWRDAQMQARSPEEAIRAAPWLPVERVRALVEANGGRIPAELGGPGYHGECRTVLIVRPPRRAA